VETATAVQVQEAPAVAAVVTDTMVAVAAVAWVFMVQDPMAQVAVLVEEPVHRDFKVAEDRAEVAQLVLELCRAEPMVAAVPLMR
jgi:hypothetical protein